MREHELKEVEKLRREIKSLRRSISNLKIVGVVFLSSILIFTYFYLLEKYHITKRKKFSRTYSPVSATIAVCGEDKIHWFKIKKGSVLGIYTVYFIVDLATGKQYPITMCEPDLAPQKIHL